MFKNNFRNLVLTLTLVLLTACSNNGNDNTQTNTLETGGGSSTTATLTNIVDTAVTAEIFTTLVLALQTTGLDTTLADESSTYTVFAPTDRAFEALGSDTINALLEDTDALSDILLYHVIADAVVDAETAVSLTGTMITMANGDKAALTLDGNKLFINQSQVFVTDVKASNGVIHVIDTVLTPPVDEAEVPQLNIVQTAVEAGSFTVLTEALAVAGLIDTLSHSIDQYTLFAPTDDAFAALPEGSLDALLADPEALSDILLYHVVSGTVVDSTAAINRAGQPVTMANGDSATFNLADGVLLVNNAAVTQVDLRASNGVIHVIDSVLIPPTESVVEPEQPDDVPPEASSQTIYETAQSIPDLSTLIIAVDAAGLAGALNHPGDQYTLFAPSNAAIAALGEQQLEALLADPAALRRILLRHVLPGTVIDSEAAFSLVGFDIQAGNGETLNLTSEGHTLFINGSQVTVTDIRAVNGVIHIINTVLTP